jgi:hypothetical protein
MSPFFTHGILADFPVVTEHKQLTCKENKVPGKINCQETMQKKTICYLSWIKKYRLFKSQSTAQLFE